MEISFYSIDAIKRILPIVLRNALKRCDRLNRSVPSWNIHAQLVVNNYFKHEDACIYLFLFQGDGNIPSCNENHHSTQVFTLLFVEKKKLNHVTKI